MRLHGKVLVGRLDEVDHTHSAYLLSHFHLILPGVQMFDHGIGKYNVKAIVTIFPQIDGIALDTTNVRGFGRCVA